MKEEDEEESEDEEELAEMVVPSRPPHNCLEAFSELNKLRYTVSKIGKAFDGLLDLVPYFVYEGYSKVRRVEIREISSSKRSAAAVSIGADSAIAAAEPAAAAAVALLLHLLFAARASGGSPSHGRRRQLQSRQRSAFGSGMLS